MSFYNPLKPHVYRQINEALNEILQKFQKQKFARALLLTRLQTKKVLSHLFGNSNYNIYVSPPSKKWDSTID
jgi:hypothetical protein